MFYDVIESQLGPIVFSCDGNGINRIQFLNCKKPNPIDETWQQTKNNPLLKEAGKQLDAYLSGTLREFSLPLSMHGTDFQVRVWNALISIPYGVTWAYKDLAASIGNPAACRAVGNANGRNNLSIVIP